MKAIFKRHYIKIFVGFAMAFFALSVIGAIRRYSPVPMADMWGPYLAAKELGWNLSQWWSQYNEHRLVIARLFFWLDMNAFKGTIVFLIVANYVFAIGIFVVYADVINHLFPESHYGKIRVILKSLVCVLAFAWIQHSNLTWGFQSQFYTAQLVPLLAFYLLYRSYYLQIEGSALFGLACVSGVLSIGTMANGVLALPLMAFMAVLYRMSWPRIALLVALALVSIFSYFHGYETPVGHSSPFETIKNQPADLLRYTFIYLGSPFFYMFGKRLEIAEAAGLMMLVILAFAAFRSLSNPRKKAPQIFLLAFISYAGISAFGTGAGRLLLGLDSAIVSRYTTPVLMAWSALLIIVALELKPRLSDERLVPSTVGALLLIPLLLLPTQLRTLQNREKVNFEKLVAALAIELGVRDESQILTVFPSLAVIELAAPAVQGDWSIFGNTAIKDIKLKMGGSFVKVEGTGCHGVLSSADALPKDERYTLITGRIDSGTYQLGSQFFYVLNKNGNTIGAVLTRPMRDGEERRHNGQETALDKDRLFFKGYLLNSDSSEGLLVLLTPDGKACNLHTLSMMQPDEGARASDQALKQDIR